MMPANDKRPSFDGQSVCDCFEQIIEPKAKKHVDCTSCLYGPTFEPCDLQIISEKMPGEILNVNEVTAKQGSVSVSPKPKMDFAYTNKNFQSEENPVFLISNNSPGRCNESSVVNIKLPTIRGESSEKEITPKGCARRFFCNESGPSNIHLLIAEFVGTGLLLFIGCMGCMNQDTDRTNYITGLAFGLTVMIIIQMFGHISGAHLNPAVTMVATLQGLLELKAVPFYLLGQFGGAIVGLGALKFIIPEEYLGQDFFDEVTNQTIHKQGICTTDIHAKMTPVQACILEAAITFVLIMVCHAIWDKRNAAKQDSIPLRFGLVISAIAIIAGPFTGASMNTARSFAPALLNNDWTNHWIYWIGPTVGGLIAHIFYKYLYAVPDEEEDNEDDNEDDYEEVGMKSMNEAKV